MLRKLFFVISAFLLTNGLFAQSGTLKGKVIDEGLKEPIPFANVVIEENGKVITGGSTDFDGNFTIKPITPGKYDVKTSSVGYTTKQITGVIIKGGQISFLNFDLKSVSKVTGTVEVVGYKVPLFDKDQTISGGAVTADDIKKMPGRSANSIAQTVGGVYSASGSETDVNIRGARSEGTVYYVDGVKVIGSSAIPKSALEQVTVMTGGVPAQYGDATGGIISVTTKGPSNKMNGGAEFQTTQYLDAFGSTIFGLNLMGPLYSKKEEDGSKKAIIGFLLSSELSYDKDGNPSILGRWKANDDIIDSLVKHPLRKAGASSTGNFIQGALMNADFLKSDAFKNIKTSMNSSSLNVKVQGKVDYQPAKNFNFTVGGTFMATDDKNYGSAVGNSDYYNQLFNWKHNPEYKNNNWRAYARITQKFANQTDDQEKKSASLIKNAYYSVQADYSRYHYGYNDPIHKDNLFAYGYVGKFNTYRTRTYQFGKDPVSGLEGMINNGFRDTLYAFQRSEVNPEASTYTEQFYGDRNYFIPYNSQILQQAGGILNGQALPKVYEIWESPGASYDRYYIYDLSQFRISATGSADVKDHEISLGFEFEQRKQSSFDVKDPVALWETARSLMNNHMVQLDLNNPIIVRDQDGTFKDTVNFNRLYNKSEQAYFDINFRKHLGLPLDGHGMNDWIDVDSYDPSEFSLDYFSADELMNNGNPLIDYYGYDTYGKKLKSKPSLNDFFTATYTDDNGIVRYKREIAPFQPTYMSGYIQDKFAFNDLIFNIGVRIDRYDANQMVLKDMYSLSETYKVGDTDPAGLLNRELPSTIQNGYVVYVDNLTNPTDIVGFRNGKVWYSKDGTVINDASTLFTATGIAPYLVNSSGKLDVKAFKDFEPEVVVMPRIAFSFPISDEASFFAHYDILSKRPSYANRLDPASYMLIQSPNVKQNALENPDQKPEKTIDYELGFQQKLGNTSALKMSAFYREMRDMQQVINVFGAYPTNYMTYGNVDFGTVKGVTLQYDLRRTNNVRLTANYTLQFANATGSDLETALNLIKAGQPNLRTTIPTDFDQRHAINVSVDYRFDGKANGIPYDGPQTPWIRMILENAGANLVINSGSGSPFSKKFPTTVPIPSQQNGSLIGSINGSRLPWATTMNIRVDKDIAITFGEGEKKHETSLNVYVEVSNLMNAHNVISVYNATGNAHDDGFLANPANQPFLNSKNDPTAYSNYYEMVANNPARYITPRRIWLGVQFSF